MGKFKRKRGGQTAVSDNQSSSVTLNELAKKARKIYCNFERSSDGGNRSHNVSLPIILKKTKVGQILQYSCISLLLVPILLYWI